jgi:hypothetical protein
MLAGESDYAQATQREGLFERLLRALGAVSLFWKVLLANALVVPGSVVAGMVLATNAAAAGREREGWLLAGYAAGVTGLTLLVNAIVLRAAFLPLQRLAARRNRSSMIPCCNA